MGAGRPLGRDDRLLVLSPHLDDAVLSVGATMAHLARRGVRVEVVTVFGGDPRQDRDPGQSNRRAGFSSTGEAARVRRREDDAACAVLGVHPTRLSFDDDEASARDADAVGEAVAPLLSAADLVLLPGGPLLHPDHLLAATAAAARVPAAVPVGLYLEQPYATWQALSRGSRRPSGTTSPVLPACRTAPDWGPSGRCPRCVRRKLAAMGAYRSQLRVLRRWPRARVLGYELLAGGERVAWPAAGQTRSLGVLPPEGGRP